MPRTPRVPPLVGKADAAEILGCHPNNMGRLDGLPEPLPGTGPTSPPSEDGMAVRATPLWPRSVIERFERSRRRS